MSEIPGLYEGVEAVKVVVEGTEVFLRLGGDVQEDKREPGEGTGNQGKVETFHSSGKGGQNVNKVETGVRVTHIPTGITIASTAERSQFLNKQDALKKLSAVLKEMEKKEKAKQKNSAWREHTQIVRGNPVRVYEGMGFKRKRDE